MADAEQLWIIIHNNVIYAIFGVITKENFNQSYSAPRCAFVLLVYVLHVIRK
jgi:hypothetical protein